MNCDESLILLNRRLDGETIDMKALELHVRECTACRELHRAGMMLAQAARDLPRPRADAELSRRIVAAVLADRRPVVRYRFAAAVSAVAASMLIGISLYLSWPRNLERPVVKNGPQPKPAEENSIASTSPKLDETMAEATEAVAALGERFADGTREHAELLWQAATPIDLSAVVTAPAESITDPLSPAAGPLRKAGAGVAQGIDTVAASARRAVDYFFRELGGSDMDAKN